ncbi:hypothetical protein HDU67_004876 [Dinochytrium kinnereticum]|nr:hypothetical protein HDU67_004876 [Dinochytrium kinnereticum]
MTSGSLGGGSTLLQQQSDQSVYAMYMPDGYLQQSEDTLGSSGHHQPMYHSNTNHYQSSHHNSSQLLSAHNTNHHHTVYPISATIPPTSEAQPQTSDRRRSSDRTNTLRDEDLNREVELLRTEVSDLRSAREADAKSISLKEKEIRDLRGRLDDVRSALIQIDADQAAGKAYSVTSAVSAARGSTTASPTASTPGTHTQSSQLSMDVIASCLQRLQISDSLDQYRAPQRRATPPFPSLVIDVKLEEGVGMDLPSAGSNGTLVSGSPSQEDLPIRRRGSMISTNSSNSLVGTAGNGQQGISGVKSIWGPPMEASIQSGMGLYGKEIMSQSPTEAYTSEPANVTAPAAESLMATSSSLNHFKSLWVANDGTAQGIAQEYGFDGSEVYGMNEMMGDTSYLDSMSPNRLQYYGGMDRYANASFHYLVDKIVKTNDQPASLHLQQKLKTGSTALRDALFDAIKSQALPLIRNRFGNFLMQRCLEHGTSAQVRVLAGAMVGHIYALSCDRFGCHVVQKALDVCEDDVKLQIISELLRAIPETITHRFACHVWQRVFETRWSGTNHRSKVAQRVDAALKGQWHLVANDENGSLVVQCIFENCEESDKCSIVREVLGHTLDIARGQWGNWVIQHLLEHGTPSDKQHILKIVSHQCYSMSIDQFASKVVEKGLKTCQRRDLYDIVDMVLSPSLRESGPGILDMMNNQYANYVVQHILTLSDPTQRDACARLIAPHLPVLRGSKYGQRVAAIVEKHIRTSQQRFGSILSVTAAQHASSSSTMSMFNGTAAAMSSIQSGGGVQQSQQQQQLGLIGGGNGPLYLGGGMPVNAWAHHMAQMPTQIFAAGGAPHAG